MRFVFEQKAGAWEESLELQQTIEALCKCDAVSLLLLPKSRDQAVMNFMAPLFARNLVHYDQAKMTIRLIPQSLLLGLRVAKLDKMVDALYKESQCQEIVHRWIENAMLPFTVDSDKNTQKAVKALVQGGILFEDYQVDSR